MTASAPTETSAHRAVPIALSVSGVGHTYASEDDARSVRALARVDVEIARGEFFAIVGPSGCGKSTLLDVIAGLATASEGSVTFEGREVRGTVPHDGVLVAAKHMSMWDTLALYLVLDDPAVVLKRGLQFIPFYGWYITKAGSIPVDRSGKASALRKMVASAKRALDCGKKSCAGSAPRSGSAWRRKPSQDQPSPAPAGSRTCGRA